MRDLRVAIEVVGGILRVVTIKNSISVRVQEEVWGSGIGERSGLMRGCTFIGRVFDEDLHWLCIGGLVRSVLVERGRRETGRGRLGGC